MSDICTLVTVFRTAMACIGPMVCAPDATVGATVCRPGPTPECNYDIETYSCKREDGTQYSKTVDRK
jgi:hypothetical protein